MNAEKPLCALVLTGGGARAAYQVGVLRAIARHLPDAKFDIITGVSAGAINAVFLASRSGPLTEIVEQLNGSNTKYRHRGRTLTVAHHTETIPCKDPPTTALPLLSGEPPTPCPVPAEKVDVYRTLHGPAIAGPDKGHHLYVRESVVDHRLLRSLAGLAESIARHDPSAVAVTTLDYTTGRTVTWVEGPDIQMWERPLRRSVLAKISVDHVMASAALPIIFPAVKVERHYHGDGGIRLSAPLAPALHLGATRMLAISTHYEKTFSEADEPQTIGYPPLAQILGQLANSVFLDVMDEDAIRLQRSNDFLRELPPQRRHGFRIVDFANIRPSEDLGNLAAGYEPDEKTAFWGLESSTVNVSVCSAVVSPTTLTVIVAALTPGAIDSVPVFWA